QTCIIGPCICQARGGACISLFFLALTGVRVWSAGEALSSKWHLGEGAACLAARAPPRAPPVASSTPGACFGGQTGGLRPSHVPDGFRHHRASPVPANLRRPFVVRADGDPGATRTSCLRHRGAGATPAPPTRRL